MQTLAEPTTNHSSMDVHMLSVCGPVRAENQDAVLAWRGDDGGVCVALADGMGGHLHGRQAAEIAVRSSLRGVRNREAELPWPEALREAVRQAHEAVRSAAADLAAEPTERSATMGATLVLAMVDAAQAPPVLHVAHVGDSRAYLHRGRSLYRLTADHSLVGQLIRDGHLTEEEAFGHPDNNVIQRALGQSSALEAELQPPLLLDAGDAVLLCSDGLHGVVPDAAILRHLEAATSATEACQRLLEAALEARSEDNVSIACVRIIPQEKPPRPTRVDVEE